MTPAEQQIKIRNIVIEHDRFREATKSLGDFHYPVNGGLHSQGCVSVLIGDSRTGKTFATTRYAKRFPPRVEGAGVIRPVVYVSMPMEGGGGMRGILESIANAIELPFSLRMNNPALTSAIMNCLVAQRVELLIFDEFDQVFRENDKRLLGFGRGLIRKLLDLGTFSIVCIGLMPTYHLLKEDPQLTGRGGLPYCVLRAYDWDNRDERSTFRLVCDTFDEHLPFDERSGLGDQDLAYRLYKASDGNFGRLKGLIEAAGAIAINERTSRIERFHFGAVYEQRKAPGTRFNWFTDDLSDAPRRQETKIKGGSPGDIFSKAVTREVHDGV